VTQVVYTLDATEKLSKAAERLGKTADIFVKVDTGLRRVGVWHEEVPDLIKRITALPSIHLDGIMSTLMQNPE
jgi:alanine racemase